VTADYAIRNYSGAAVKTYLTTGMTTGDTATTINDPTGWPSSAFWALFDVATVNEELVYVATRSGSNLTGIVRNITGAGAKSHQAGTSTFAWHSGAFQDFVEANAIAAALTTKGDSLWKGGTASVAPARLAAGTDQQIIRYKAANSLGVETTHLGSIPVFATTGARDAAIPSPSGGQACYVDDGTSAEGLQFYNGTAWRQVSWNQPWGVLTAPVSITSAQTGIGTGLTDLTSLVTGSVTAVGNRYWRISFRCSVSQQTSAGLVEITINTGASGAGTQLQSSQNQLAATTTGAISDYVITTPAAGATQYHLRGHTSANTFDRNGSATQPASIVLEDLGPQGAPA
jgi:hypothetical protein